MSLMDRRTFLGMSLCAIQACALGSAAGGRKDVPMGGGGRGASASSSGKGDALSASKDAPKITSQTLNNSVYLDGRLYLAHYASGDDEQGAVSPPAGRLLGRVRRTGITEDFQDFDAGVLPVGTALYEAEYAEE